MGKLLHKVDMGEDASYRVLVIDDNKVELQNYTHGLGHEFDLSFSPNAREAWELLNSTPLPDAIIIDIMLPNEDGIQLCNRIKETQLMQDVPIIFVSSPSGPDIRSQAFDIGGADFVSKPPVMNELMARLKRHMAIYRKTKKLESLIFIDPLTHLPNASKFQEVLNVEWARCARYWHHLSLLMINIENLESVEEATSNDKYYSSIAAVAAGLSTAGNRPGDLVATLSNDKFVVLLSDCGHEGANLKAKQIMTQFDNGALGSNASHLSCTIGYAVAAPAGGGSPDALFRAVDNIMYESEQNGKRKIYSVNGIIGVDE